MEPDPLRLELELRRAGDPIEGVLSSEHGKPVSFIGWLELVAAVEAVRADDHHERGGTEELPPVEKGTWGGGEAMTPGRSLHRGKAKGHRIDPVPPPRRSECAASCWCS